MSYEITKQDFGLIVQNPKCQGVETENAPAKVGHESCNHCKGNYFVGGECNYGGRHTMERDLQAINQNFRAFDVLVKNQVKLSKSKNEVEFNRARQTLLSSFANLKAKCEEESGTGFFYGSCIGLDGSQTAFSEQIKETFKRLAKELGYYIQQVENSSWQQLHQFQEKLKKLDSLNKESMQMTEDWKNETDPLKKAQLLTLLTQKNQEISNLQRELKADPVYSLYSQEKSEELANIVKNIFQGKENFFNWPKPQKQPQQEQKTDKYFGLLPKEQTKNLGLILLAGLAIVIIYQTIKNKFTE